MADARVIRLHPDEEPPPAGSSEPATSTTDSDRDELGTPPGPDGWERRAAAGLAFLRRRITGDYEVDEFGFDADLTENLMLPAARQLYRSWFRTEATGVQHLPAESGALIVANHAGALWALDGVMTATAVHDETPNHRFLRLLGADLVFTTPLLGELARKGGSTLAS